MPFGNKSLESDWIRDNANRDFDVILLFYHEHIQESILKDNSKSFTLFHLKNFKWVMIQDLFLKIDLELIDQYDYFFFVDDDIEISKSDISFLFYNMKEHHLQMSQPALTRRSYKSWKSLRRKLLSGLRYLSSVELMCPMMSRDCVKLLLPTFALNKSGWGIDILWGKMVRDQFGPKSIAVFDTIRATHSKPVGKGELYEKLDNPAVKERDEIFARYQLEEKAIYTLPLSDNTFSNRLVSYFRLDRAKKNFLNNNKTN